MPIDQPLLKTFLFTVLIACCHLMFAQSYYMEELGRGLVAIDKGSGQVFLSWRMLGTDPEEVSFDVYRNDVLVTDEPIVNSTNYQFQPDAPSSSDHYEVVANVAGVPVDTSKAVQPWNDFYKNIPITPPVGGTTPSGNPYTYSANDASVADLDGDGELEIVLKSSPSNAHDNANGGYTGSTILEGLEMDGTSLWQIDLGINIRSGSHYTQFMVYDLDSDGKAEVACKTADGSVDGLGRLIGDGEADYRNDNGYILDGPEFLTIFNGETGAELVTTDYYPARGDVSSWGDSYGNRVDRFLACIAYLDGEKPSLVMCRGYYTRTVLAAYDYRNGELTSRWIFDTGHGSNPYKGQGNHSLSVGDVDNDGKDEIVYGACAIDDNGEGLYSTGFGHGDAGHLADIDPDEEGLEFFMPHESANGTSRPQLSIRNAATGEVQWIVPGSGDIGRGVTMDIDPNHRGYEVWASNGSGVHDKDGNVITNTYPVASGGARTYNFGVWWDADLQREYFDRGVINKWNPNTFGSSRLVTLYNIEGASTNNSTKSNPCLQADLLGDWREEVLMRNPSSTALLLFMNSQVTTHRLRTLMHDRQYRLAIAWQNVAYNQPPHTSFYLGDGMKAPPRPNIRLAKICLSELRSLPYGEYTRDELASMGISIDDISNLYLPMGSSLVLFERINFSGSRHLINGSDACKVTQPEGTYQSLIFSETPFTENFPYTIRSKLTDKVLSVESPAAGEGDFIVFDDKVEGVNQSWILKNYLGMNSTYFTLSVSQTGYLMEIAESAFAVQGVAASNLPPEEQLFEILPNTFDPEYFMIKSMVNDLCLSVDLNSAGVVCVPCSMEDEGQKFYQELTVNLLGLSDSSLESTQTLYYPNPFNDFIRFEIPGMKRVEVLSLTGQLLFENNLQSHSDLDLSFLDKGVYLVRIKTIDSTRIIKIVK